MSPTRIGVMATAIGLATLATSPRGAQAQSPRPRPVAVRQAEARPTIAGLQAIQDEYDRQLLRIERERLARLDRLASSQPPEQAEATYETLFRLAISNNLFAEADPAADRILAATSAPSSAVRFLAETINLIASADRGEYDRSLADLRRLVGPSAKSAGAGAAARLAPSTVLDTPSLLILCGAYYQRLVQGGRFDVAREAFALLEKEANNADVKEYCRQRLRQLDLVGKPAPALRGFDVDGKPVNLAAMRGDAVLVVFWATWCVPNAAEVEWLDGVYEANRGRGFRIVGINLDALQNGGSKPENVQPAVRQFLLEHNVRWPNLITAPGPDDIAAAFGISEIPSNVLIGRDGKVLQVDLSRKNMAEAVATALR